MKLKISVIIAFSFFFFYSYGQVMNNSELRELDSLELIAYDSTNGAKERIIAFKKLSWRTIYREYELGIKYSEDYLSLAIETSDTLNVIQGLHYKGYVLLMLGDFEKADSIYQSGLKYSSIISNYRWMAEFYGDLGNLANAKGQTREAFEYHNLCLDIGERHNINKLIARAKLNLAELYAVQGNYSLSLDILKEVLAFVISKNNVGYRSAVHTQLGDVYMNINEFEIAERQYNEALIFADSLNNTKRKVKAYEKLGELKLSTKKYREALEFWNKGLVIAKSNKLPLLLGVLQSDIAMVKTQQKEKDSAIYYISQAINLYENLSIKEGMELIYYKGATIHMTFGNKEIAFNYFVKSYDLAIEKNNITVLKGASLGLAESYKEQGEYQKSNNYYRDYIFYNSKNRDRMDLRKALKMEINSRYESKRISDSLNKNTEIRLLSSEHQNEMERNKAKSYLAMALAAVLLIVLSFVVILYLVNRKSAKILTDKNVLISKSLADKEILLKEVHHRVKNNMQIVSSLLLLKSRNSKNAIAQSELMDSKSRIDAMQLIHQRMYKNDNYEQIDIVEYSRDITKLLLTPLDSKEYKFELIGDNILVNVEQSQTLGFIIHELITNSIKYAWPEKVDKRIDIEFFRSDDLIQFTYKDNGIGLDQGFVLERSESFGMKLIESLVTRQLEGDITMFNDSGSNVIIVFNNRE